MNFSLRFTVPGDPVPKARHRTGRFGGTYTPQKTVDYETTVGWSARQAMLYNRIEPLNSDRRFALYVDFFIAPQKGDPKRMTRCDLDNLTKSILDGLTPHKPRGRAKPPGLFWKDDEQVDIIAAQKEPCVDNPRAEVVVKML